MDLTTKFSWVFEEENENPLMELREERRYKSAIAAMEAVSRRIGDLGLCLLFVVLWIAIDVLCCVGLQRCVTHP